MFMSISKGSIESLLTNIKMQEGEDLIAEMKVASSDPRWCSIMFGTLVW